jgi:hypothetical protein
MSFIAPHIKEYLSKAEWPEHLLSALEVCGSYPAMAIFFFSTIG